MNFIYVVGYAEYGESFAPYFFCDSLEEAMKTDGCEFKEGNGYWYHEVFDCDEIQIHKVPVYSVYRKEQEKTRQKP